MVPNWGTRGEGSGTMAELDRQDPVPQTIARARVPDPGWALKPSCDLYSSFLRHYARLPQLNAHHLTVLDWCRLNQRETGSKCDVGARFCADLSASLFPTCSLCGV